MKPVTSGSQPRRISRRTSAREGFDSIKRAHPRLAGQGHASELQRPRCPGEACGVRAIAIPFLVVCASLSLACHAPPGVERAADAAAAPAAADTREPCADHNPLRNPYFGDLHVHTSRSFDAFMYDTRATPRDAYRFARGEEIEAAPLDPADRPSRVAKLQRPLDFAAVTDHAELMGEGALCTNPASPAYASASCQGFRGTAAQPH